MSATPIPDDVIALLVPGEEAVVAYTAFRDSAIFTTKRLIVRDAQGLRGKKVELWTRAGKIKIGRDLDMRRLDMLISQAVLGAK